MTQSGTSKHINACNNQAHRYADELRSSRTTWNLCSSSCPGKLVCRLSLHAYSDKASKMTTNNNTAPCLLTPNNQMSITNGRSTSICVWVLSKEWRPVTCQASAPRGHCVAEKPYRTHISSDVYDQAAVPSFLGFDDSSEALPSDISQVHLWGRSIHFQTRCTSTLSRVV